MLTLATWKIDSIDSLTVKTMNSQLSGTDYNTGFHKNKLHCPQQVQVPSSYELL